MRIQVDAAAFNKEVHAQSARPLSHLPAETAPVTDKAAPYEADNRQKLWKH